MVRKLKFKRVLIAEDNDIVREILAIVLGNLRCEVETVADGMAALEKISQRDFSLVLTDLQMPKINGLQVGYVAKKKNPGTFVILMTGYAEELRKEEARMVPREVGATYDRLLKKPITLRQLSAEIQASEKIAFSLTN